MKKTLSLILSLMLIVSVLGIPACAETTTDRYVPITISDPAHLPDIK